MLCKGHIRLIFLETESGTKTLPIADIGKPDKHFLFPAHHGLVGQFKFALTPNGKANNTLISENGHHTVGVLVGQDAIMLVG